MLTSCAASSGESVSSRFVSVGFEGAEHAQQLNAAQPERCWARAKSRKHELGSTQVLLENVSDYARGSTQVFFSLEGAPSMRLWRHTSLSISRVFKMHLLEMHKRSVSSCACVNSQACLFRECACDDARVLVFFEYSSVRLRRHKLSRSRVFRACASGEHTSFSHLENVSIMRL